MPDASVPSLVAKLGDPFIREAAGTGLTFLALLYLLVRTPRRRTPGVGLFLAGLILLAASFALGLAGQWINPPRVGWLDPSNPWHAALRDGLRYGLGLPLFLLGVAWELTQTRRRLFREAGVSADTERRTKDLARAVEDVVRLEDSLAERNRDLASTRDELRRQASEASRVSTKLRETLNLLLASEEKFRSIFEKANDGFAIVDLETREILQANPRMAELTGGGKENVAQGEIDDLFGQAFGGRGQDQLQELAGRGSLPPVTYRRSDGSEIRLEISFSLVDVGGRPVLLGIARDVSERERLLNELELKNQALEEREKNLKEANAELSERAEKMRSMNDKLRELQEVKDNFLSSVSHELRTPLTSIRSFSEILLEYKDAEDDVKSEFISIINKESERLTRLINDVLDIARIEAGEMKFSMAVVDLTELARDVSQSVSPLAAKKRIAVDLDFVEDLPAVEGDRDKLFQVLANLLSNAIKFSPPDTQVSVAARPARDGLVEVRIRDQGRGIPPDELQGIFDKFRQVDFGDTVEARPEGTGLGLAICREIITLHGGRIWVRSRVGEGSTFHFTVRAYRSAEIDPEEPAAAREEASTAAEAVEKKRPAAGSDKLPPLRRARAGTGHRSSLPPLVDPTRASAGNTPDPAD